MIHFAGNYVSYGARRQKSFLQKVFFVTEKYSHLPTSISRVKNDAENERKNNAKTGWKNEAKTRREKRSKNVSAFLRRKYEKFSPFFFDYAERMATFCFFEKPTPKNDEKNVLQNGEFVPIILPVEKRTLLSRLSTPHSLVFFPIN